MLLSFFQLIYSLNTGRDYGTILCWAENKLGTQLEPCVFHLIPAGKVNNISSIILMIFNLCTQYIPTCYLMGFELESKLTAITNAVIYQPSKFSIQNPQVGNFFS